MSGPKKGDVQLKLNRALDITLHLQGYKTMTNTLNNITVSLQTRQSDDADVMQLCAFRLNANGKVNSQEDFIHSANDSISIDMKSVPEKIRKIVFTVTLSESYLSFGQTDTSP